MFKNKHEKQYFFFFNWTYFLVCSLQMYPLLEDESKALLPPGSFLTASGDDTVRVWNLNTHMPENTAFKRNIYSNVSSYVGSYWILERNIHNRMIHVTFHLN